MTAAPFPLVTIHRGPGGVHADRATGALVWDAPSPVAWGGLRSFVAQLRERLGDAAIEGALSPEVRPVLSLALRGLATRLTDAERRVRDEARGRVATELPNSIARRRPFRRAWEDFVRALLPGRPLVVVVPEIGRVDLESLGAIHALLRAAKGHALRLVVGHDPALAPDAPVDSFLREAQLAVLARLEALPGARVERHEEARPVPRATHRDPLDDGLEARAFESLARGSPDRALLLDAMRASLDAHGYEAALRLTLALGDSPDDSPEDRRAFHLTRAIAAHNLAPFARREWLVDAMVASFTSLLAEERDACARSHFAYRLGMLHGRGRGDVAAAVAHADRAVREAQDAKSDPRAPFFEAWARNGRAYAHFRAGRPEDAARDCEVGLAGLASGAAGSVPDVDVRLVQLLLANNRTRVASESGDAAERDRWIASTKRYRDAVPVDEQPGYQWLPVTEDELHLDVARRHYDAQLADARDALDPELEAVAAHALGVVEYKLGNAARARELFATSLRIWRILKGFPEDLLTEELNCAVTAFRCGDVASAKTQFEALRASALLAEPAAQAEVVGALAMVAGRAKDRAAAEAHVRDALALAEEGGDAGSLLRTLRSAAEARLELGDAAGARPLLAHARAVADAAVAAGEEPGPEDLLGVLVSSLDAGERDAALLAAAVAAAPRALGDANAWWDLPRLVVHVREAIARGAAIDAAALFAAARQRGDSGAADAALPPR